MEPQPIVCVIILLTGGLGHTQTCNPVEKQSRTGTQYELIILTWPVWRNLRDLKNFKNIWSRWRLFQDVWEKTETRTTMKGNCMSLDCKWLVCTPRGGRWRSSTNMPELHQSLDVVIIKQILKIWRRKNRKNRMNSTTVGRHLYLKCFCKPGISS